MLVLHATKLSAMAEQGVPLARWGVGVTLLLDKIVGDTYVNTLRAIYLLKADFNWWNKLGFTRQLMQIASSPDFISQEIHSKKDSHCNKATVSKVCFCNRSRILYKREALREDDFGDYYDCTAHAPASIVLQTWGTPTSACRLIFVTFQTIQFCLKKGFRKSKNLFDGTTEEPFAGHIQSNTIVPRGFITLATLHAERPLGETDVIIYDKVVHPDAIMYVDDTALLYWPSSLDTTDKESIKKTGCQ